MQDEFFVKQLEIKIKEAAKKFTDDNLNNPTQTEYLLMENCMTIGWELGVREAIRYMRENGINLG